MADDVSDAPDVVPEVMDAVAAGADAGAGVEEMSAVSTQGAQPNAPQKDNPGAARTGAPQPADVGKAGSGSIMSLDAVRNIPVTLTVVLGSVNVPVSELMNMQRGNTIALKKKVGEPVDILANGKLIARGEIVVLEEEEPVFAVSLTELVSPAIASASAKSQ